jgi:hypothetical protein
MLNDFCHNFIKAVKKRGLLGTFTQALIYIWNVVISKFLHCKALLGLIINKNFGCYRIIDIAKVGYAVRSAELIETQDNKYIVTADVGDDSLSILPLVGGKLGNRNVIRFPEKSAPIGIKAIKHTRNGNSEGLLIAVFNFDATGEKRKNTYVCHAIVADLLKEPADECDIRSSSFERILSREGHWGFRCVNCYEALGGTNYIISLDRGADLAWIIELLDAPNSSLRDGKIHRVPLGYIDTKAEPIFAAIVPSECQNEAPDFIISQRGKAELTTVSRLNDGEYRIASRVSVGGGSRSSVAVGKFWNRKERGVAVALWGGDPTDLREIAYGKLVVFHFDHKLKCHSPVFVNAGVHPTDIVVGDFDGDGIDELAVLNYGSGLSPMDRIHPGSVQIFKWIDDIFKKVSEINIPYPRIGISADIDDDGRDELLVSLFFEKRLVTIKSSV